MIVAIAEINKGVNGTGYNICPNNEGDKRYSINHQCQNCDEALILWILKGHRKWNLPFICPTCGCNLSMPFER